MKNLSTIYLRSNRVDHLQAPDTVSHYTQNFELCNTFLKIYENKKYTMKGGMFIKRGFPGICIYPHSQIQHLF